MVRMGAVEKRCGRKHGGPVRKEETQHGGQSAGGRSGYDGGCPTLGAQLMPTTHDTETVADAADLGHENDAWGNRQRCEDMTCACREMSFPHAGLWCRAPITSSTVGDARCWYEKAIDGGGGKKRTPMPWTRLSMDEDARELAEEAGMSARSRGLRGRRRAGETADARPKLRSHPCGDAIKIPGSAYAWIRSAICARHRVGVLLDGELREDRFECRQRHEGAQTFDGVVGNSLPRCRMTMYEQTRSTVSSSCELKRTTLPRAASS